LIDLHSHILPGVDDGARSLDSSVEMARAAAADGVSTIAATPHVRDDYPTPPETMERLVEEVRAAVRAAEVELEVRPGGEIALERLSGLNGEDLRRFGLGGNPGYLLIECPYAGWPLNLADRLFHLRADGITPVLAHPERNLEVQVSPERLRPLVESGTLVQLTAASVDGRLGRTTQRSALALLERGLAHLIASDAHAPSVRQIGMSAAAATVGDDALARWLVHDVPASILENRDLPPRPSARPQRKRRWFLAGRRS
jgi:protein-tyrosine phosphatase